MGIFSKKSADIPRRRAENPSTAAPANPALSGSFRRNANLSKYSHVAQGDSPRIHYHHLSIKRRKLLLVLLATLLIIGLLSFLINQFTASVSIVITNNNSITNVDLKKYQDAIQAYLNANPLSRLRFVLDNNRLNDYVVSNIDEVSSVVQKTMTGFGMTEFDISLREPVASWKIGDDQYYVDSSGIAFETNCFAEPAVKVIDKSGAYIEAGSASISKRFLGFVGRVVALTGQSGYVISEAILPENTTRQLNVKISGSNLLVKMTIDRSVADQVGDMSRAVEYFKLSGRTPQYLDVRVDDKVFYVE